MNSRKASRKTLDSAFTRRCCTALAESKMHLLWWPRYVRPLTSRAYPKRSQYKHAKQKKYHVRNWAEYNEGLRRRGDLTVWFDEEAIANWMADKTGKPGGQRVYSDMAIETSLVVRMVYKLAYRQTEGFLHSIGRKDGCFHNQENRGTSKRVPPLIQSTSEEPAA